MITPEQRQQIDTDAQELFGPNVAPDILERYVSIVSEMVYENTLEQKLKVITLEDAYSTHEYLRVQYNMKLERYRAITGIVKGPLLKMSISKDSILSKLTHLVNLTKQINTELEKVESPLSVEKISSINRDLESL